MMTTNKEMVEKKESPLVDPEEVTPPEPLVNPKENEPLSPLTEPNEK